MLRRNGLVIKSAESVLRPEVTLWWERFVKEIRLEPGVKERGSYGWWEWWVDGVRLRRGRSMKRQVKTERLEWGCRRELESWFQRHGDDDVGGRVTFKVIHLLLAFSKMLFSYSSVAVDKMSTDIERRAVPLRKLSFLLWSPYGIGQTIIFSSCLWSPYVIGQTIIFMVALCNRADHYIFMLWFVLLLLLLSSFFFLA